MEQQIIEGAYYAGFEPSAEDLPIEALFEEAREFLTSLTK